MTNVAPTNTKRLALGVGAAAVDGFLLALWGLATKGMGVGDPNYNHYGIVLGLSGLSYLMLAKFQKANEQILKYTPGAISILIIFSMISILQFVLGVFLFEYKGAELSISSLLRNTSLIFAAILCHFAWIAPNIIPEKRLNIPLLFGIVLFIFSCWLCVGMPGSNVSWMAAISMWGAISVLIGFNRAITEVLSFSMTIKSNRYTMNVVVGICLLAALPVFLLVGWSSESDFKMPRSAWISLIAVAVIIPIAQSFRFTALSLLKDVVGKKGIAIWMFLFSSFVFSMIVFHEPASIPKITGLSLALVAVVFLDPGMYYSFFRRKMV